MLYFNNKVNGIYNNLFTLFVTNKYSNKNESQLLKYAFEYECLKSFAHMLLSSSNFNKNNTKKEKKLLCEANDKDNIKEEKQPDEMEMMQQMNNNMSYMMPIMSVLIAIIAPLGLALYWFISNVLMIIERLIIDKFINQKEEIENE